MTRAPDPDEIETRPPGRYPPREDDSPSDPIPLDYRDRSKKQPYPAGRYRFPGRGDHSDLRMGCLLYLLMLIAFCGIVSFGGTWRSTLESCLLGSGVMMVIAIAMSAAFRRWRIAIGVGIGVLLSAGFLGLAYSLCGP